MRPHDLGFHKCKKLPTLQGSSGSPVIDEYGNLVAVNFAKLGTTDNFNFGIPEERIKEFLKR